MTGNGFLSLGSRCNEEVRTIQSFTSRKKKNVCGEPPTDDPEPAKAQDGMGHMGCTTVMTSLEFNLMCLCVCVCLTEKTPSYNGSKCDCFKKTLLRGRLLKASCSVIFIMESGATGVQELQVQVSHKGKFSQLLLETFGLSYDC